MRAAPSHGAASFVKENFARGGPKKCQEAREGRDPNEHKQTDIAPEVCLGDDGMHTSLLCLETFKLSLSKFVYGERFLSADTPLQKVHDHASGRRLCQNS